MVRLNRIYTRTGDAGQTRLVGGQQVEKDSLRIEAYGTIDELNAILGIVRSNVAAGPAGSEPHERLLAWLALTQNRLFDLGSDLATRLDDRFEGLPVIQAEDATALEVVIDALNEDLEPLTSFVLPGGGPINASLHLARTVCRRAERLMVTLAREEPLGDAVIPYVNRLSDALFVWSRWVSHHLGEEELLWAPGVRP